MAHSAGFEPSGSFIVLNGQQKEGSITSVGLVNVTFRIDFESTKFKDCRMLLSFADLLS